MVYFPGLSGVSYMKNLIALVGMTNITSTSIEHKIDWKAIESEYNLIQEKKSRLSANQRKLIVSMWESREHGNQ